MAESSSLIFPGGVVPIVSNFQNSLMSGGACKVGSTDVKLCMVDRMSLDECVIMNIMFPWCLSFL